MDEGANAKFMALETKVRRDRKELRRQHRHLRQFLAVTLGALATIFSLAFAGMGFFVGWIHSTDTTERSQFEARLRSEFRENLDREKSDREKLETQLQDELKTTFDREKSERERFQDAMTKQITGSLEGGKLALFYKELGGAKVDLNHHEVTVETLRDPDDKNHHWEIKFLYILANTSSIGVNTPVVKYYFNTDKISFKVPSYDEDQYKFESTIQTSGQIGTRLPGGYGAPISVQMWTDGRAYLKREPILIKVFYGKGDVAKAAFYLTTSP